MQETLAPVLVSLIALLTFAFMRLRASAKEDQHRLRSTSLISQRTLLDEDFNGPVNGSDRDHLYSERIK